MTVSTTGIACVDVDNIEPVGCRMDQVDFVESDNETEGKKRFRRLRERMAIMHRKHCH
jgi:hypothetical protein